jgi:hypothetical protein
MKTPNGREPGFTKKNLSTLENKSAKIYKHI